MSVTLNTQLGSLVFTSQIPDIDLTTSDGNEAIVMVATSGIDYWIYGHSHRNIDKTIGATHCPSATNSATSPTTNTIPSTGGK